VELKVKEGSPLVDVRLDRYFRLFDNHKHALIDPALEADQVRRTRAVRERRDPERAATATDALRTALQEGSIEAVTGEMYNIFEAPVLSRRPVAADVKRILLGAGAMGAMMSGSGPSVFGIFESERAAIQGADALQNAGYRSYLCCPIAIN